VNGAADARFAAARLQTGASAWKASFAIAPAPAATPATALSDSLGATTVTFTGALHPRDLWTLTIEISGVQMGRFDISIGEFFDEMAKDTFTPQDVKLVREFDPSIPEILGDANRLVQVFLNLARNALQALDGDGRLLIETRTTLDHRLGSASGPRLPGVVVTVEDDGPGIPPELRAKVTTPFFTTRRGGTGLGLAVAGHWVARHGGTLRIGDAPQDRKYAGEPTRLEVGDRNVFREFCTINRGTVAGRGVTTIGDDCLFMAYSHVAHDCIVGSQCIMSNCTALAGHVQLGDWVILSGYSGIHQFCKVGSHAFLANNAAVTRDVPPYLLVAGSPAEPKGVNSEGLKRRGFAPEQIANIKSAYRLLYRSGLKLAEATAQLRALVPGQPELAAFVDFLAASERSLIR